MNRNRTLAAVSITLAASGAALALTPAAPANFGDIGVAPGFQNHTVQLFAGGAVNALTDVPGGNCRGYVTDAPDVKLTVSGGFASLFIFVQATADTTLIINDANGNWICDDDGAGGVNPLVSFQPPAPGRYDIWIGTYSQGGAQPATLFISEVGAPAPT